MRVVNGAKPTLQMRMMGGKSQHGAGDGEIIMLPPRAVIDDPIRQRRRRFRQNTATRNIPKSAAQSSVLVEFIDENGGGPGVRLRKWHQKKS